MAGRKTTAGPLPGERVTDAGVTVRRVAPGRVYHDAVWASGLDDLARLLAFACEGFADWATGEDVRPSVDTLAQMVNRERKAVMRALDRVRQAGLLDRTQRGGGRGRQVPSTHALCVPAGITPGDTSPTSTGPVSQETSPTSTGPVSQEKSPVQKGLVSAQQSPIQVPSRADTSPISERYKSPSSGTRPLSIPTSIPSRAGGGVEHVRTEGDADAPPPLVDAEDDLPPLPDEPEDEEDFDYPDTYEADPEADPQADEGSDDLAAREPQPVTDAEDLPAVLASLPNFAGTPAEKKFKSGRGFRVYRLRDAPDGATSRSHACPVCGAHAYRDWWEDGGYKRGCLRGNPFHADEADVALHEAAGKVPTEDLIVVALPPPSPQQVQAQADAYVTRWAEEHGVDLDGRRVAVVTATATALGRGVDAGVLADVFAQLSRSTYGVRADYLLERATNRAKQSKGHPR